MTGTTPARVRRRLLLHVDADFLQPINFPFPPPPFSLDFFGELGMLLVLRHSFRTSSENATMGAVLERSLNLECLTDNDQAALEKDMAAIVNSPEGATLLALIGRRHRSLRQNRPLSRQ
ncbi:hypothetical protein B0H14DRAFT_2583293 [Mycena olivaceomarginata]|nr:hypothetical protein B0H14DRAFT_2583293 [Mycena olivaceomarginata]